jgi:TANFOR domain-containing protein
MQRMITRSAPGRFYSYIPVFSKAARVFAGMVFLLAGYSQRVSAQTYPVQVITQLTPPYSVKLSDYTGATADRMAVNVFADIARPELQVKFRLRIEGQNVTITTKPEYNPPPVTIRGGMPERFTGYDLAEYFNPANLTFQGITRQQFMKTGSLPEGFYRFQVEVLEYNRGIPISNTGTANAWLILNDPPIVNLPRQDEKLKPQSPQNVLIQWTPRHTGSPNSAFATEYEVTMVEVWPASRNPNDAILTSPPIFETTTQSTTIVYGPAETPLEPGRRYAFRVRAKSMVGIEEMDLFKNKGYSEVVSFVYGDACDLPTGIRAESLNSTRFTVNWDGQLNHTGYKVRYRLAGDNTAPWFEDNTVMNEAVISSLKANTKYEYQVAGVCGLFNGPYSTVATIITKEAPPMEYSCGIPMETFNLDPASLATSLKVGDIVQAGDFDVELVKVSGSNGVFSGEGFVAVPFFNNAKAFMTFNNIMVSKELRMVKGFMNVTGAGVDVVPDEILAVMNELSETLDEIDGVLDDAEEVLDKIDDVLNIVDVVLKDAMEYLPNDIVQEINTARTQIVAARDGMKAATTPEEKEQAKTELRAAKQKLKDAAVKAVEYYAEAIKKFVNIIVTSLKELAQEATRDKDDAATLHSEREEDLDQYIANSNDPALQNGAASDAALEPLDDFSRQLTEEELQNKLNSDADFKNLYDKTLNYLLALRKYKLTQVLIGLGQRVANQQDVDDLVALIKESGVDLLKQIATKLKEREEQRVIIDYTKDQLVQSLSNVVDAIITE